MSSIVLPNEIIIEIFEYAGEYRFYPQFRNNTIVPRISPNDYRYIVLQTIPKKVVIKNTNTLQYKHYQVQISFGIQFEDLSFRMSYKETEFVGSIGSDGTYHPKYKEYKIYFTKIDRRYNVNQYLKIYSHTIQ